MYTYVNLYFTLLIYYIQTTKLVIIEIPKFKSTSHLNYLL